MTGKRAEIASVHVVASINRDIGGPAMTVSRLVSELNQRGVRSTLATLDYRRHGPQCQPVGARLESVRAGPIAAALRGWSPALSRRVRAAAADTQIVHNHGLWMFPNHYAATAARAAGVRLVFSPRGMLEPWALARNAARKDMVWRLWQRADLAQAALLHATSSSEAQTLRSLGFSQPIAMIPNGVELPATTAPPREILESIYPELRGKCWLLFLSRLHPKKGVIELLNAWRDLGGFTDWHLVLAGPALDGFGGDVARAIESAGISSRVTRTGMLEGDVKRCALAHASLFVLPSHSENFGVVVAEALAAGLPVVTTRGTPWQAVQEQSCGWWVEMTRLEQSLRDAMSLPPEQLRAMGVRGRQWASRRFDWGDIADGMRAAYLWLLGMGPRPDCIQDA